MEGNRKETITDLGSVLRSAHTIFKQYDQDRNEVLQSEELLQLLKDCQITASEEDCRRCMEQMDTNGDGVWDFVEFMTFLGMIHCIKLDAKKARKAPKKAKKPNIPPRKDSLKSKEAQKTV